MFQSLHFHPTFITDYDKGWAQDAQPVPMASTVLPPDRPPTQVYAIYPSAHVPPYHYPNPVTGEMAHYPPVGAPDPALARAALVIPGAKFAPQPVRDVSAALAKAERGIQRVKAYYEIENLESAYGYYLDKNLWNDLANLFSVDGSMELAQRGAYDGREHVRAFLLKVFGTGQRRAGGRPAGQSHAAAGRSSMWPRMAGRAKIRIRMFQQMTLGTRVSVGAAVYENTAVLEGRQVEAAGRPHLQHAGRKLRGRLGTRRKSDCSRTRQGSAARPAAFNAVPDVSGGLRHSVPLPEPGHRQPDRCRRSLRRRRR